MFLFELTSFFSLQENVHFYAADMIISVIENMKCGLLSQQQSESCGTEETSRSRGTGAEVTFSTQAKQEPGSSASSHTGCEGKLRKCLNAEYDLNSGRVLCPVLKEGHFPHPLKMCSTHGPLAACTLGSS